MAGGTDEQEFVLRVVERCLVDRITTSEGRYKMLRDQLPGKVREWAMFARTAYRGACESMSDSAPRQNE